MIERLDYPEVDIKLHVTSQVERDLRINSCKKEKETVTWLSSLPAKTFFDIGANVGAYSFVAASLGHSVYAFEPPGPTFDRFEQNIDLNEGLRVMPYAVLLGDENGPVPFSYSSLEPGAACHSLGAAGEHVETLEMRTLDLYVSSFNLPWPDYMKIDTDGSELRVLVGAELCLQKVTSLLVEVDDDLPISEQVVPFLARQGFEVSDWHRHGNGRISNVRFDR